MTQLTPGELSPEPGSDSAAPHSASRGPAALVAALIVALVLLAAAALVGAVQLREAGQRDDARAAALVAARQEALNLTSIDERDIDNDLKRVLAGATGNFARDVAQQQAQIKSVVVANHSISDMRVIDAALVRCDLQTATALVVVSGTVKNKAAPAGHDNGYRMQLDLEQHGSRWLTSALQFVG